MELSRRQFFGFLGTGAAAVALPGSLTAAECRCSASKIALQLYSIRGYIGKVGLDRALEDVAAIGYKAVEFAGYYQYGNDAKGLLKALRNAGIKACGTHISTGSFGFDANKGLDYNSDAMKKTCEFNMAYGNNVLICPGGGNFPGKDVPLDDFMKRLVELYNKAAADAAKFGCRIGIHPVPQGEGG